MLINLSELGTAQTYFTMTQTVVPRPIAWVLSENQGGDFNLAPYSYFNAICSDPPLVTFSAGLQPNGQKKDTLVNVSERPEFVIHIASCDQLPVLNETSATLPLGKSEVTASNIELVSVDGFRMPRIADSKIAFMCEVHQIQEIGNNHQSLIIAEVKSIYVDDECTHINEKGRLQVDANKIQPLARLGASQYVSFGEILTATRPA
ncbi:MAG: flavin reductase family protein [Gammaproteobacteria bacterium]|nr:flavin reductase family protein [Gammaproteobacteria bacterium]